MSSRVHPTQLLIDQCSEAALVHERGVVVMANGAAARLVRVAQVDGLIGRDVASVLCAAPTRYGEILTEVRTSDGESLPVCAREHPLVSEGRVQRALLLRPVRPTPPAPSTALEPVVRDVVSSLRGALHHAAAGVTLHLPPASFVVGDVGVLRGLLAVLLLDATCGLDPARARENEVIVDVVATGPHVELAIEARGPRAATLPGGADSFGVALARLAAAVLGAELHEDAAGANLRRVIVHMVRASAPSKR